MSCTEINKTSIVEVFNAMDFSCKLNICNFQNSGDFLKAGEATDINKMEDLSELRRILKVTPESKPFDSALDAAVKAQNEWKSSSPLKRANSLHKVWKNLRNISKSLSNSKKEFLTLANYFDFYSDLAINIEEYKNCKPCGVVLVVLSNYSPFFIFGVTIPPALATGCSVIVLVPEKIKVISLFLEGIMLLAGLPKGLFNTVTEFSETDLPVSKEISKVFFCGSYSSAVKLYTRNITTPFNFFCPDNTAAFILESGDLDAAVDKIVTERCDKNSLFAVSTVVIQESIYRSFLEKLKYRMHQFINTNKNSKIKDTIIAEKVNKMTMEALNAGAFVEKFSDSENEISQIVTVNYQNQDIDEDGSILKVLLCRTAREGIMLLNNCRYNLGISIWSEISSQALEISCKLICPNIWINCHGVFEAGEPLQLSGCSGNCVLGGTEGIFEFLSFSLGLTVEVNRSSENERPNAENVDSPPTALSAQNAFNTWQHVKNRRQYVKDIADSLEENKELSNLSEMIHGFAHLANLTTLSQRNPQGSLVLKRKTPVGVFLLLVNTISIDIKSFASLITPVIAFGNAVIIILKEINSAVNMLIKNFNNILPKNLITVIVGIKNGIHLASDSHIQAIWVYDETATSSDFLEIIKSHSGRSLKHIWIIPKNVPVSQHFFQKECLRNQVVWLTSADQFP